MREFLVTQNNAVVRRELDTFLQQQLGPDAWERFTARERGAFDYRASVIAEWVSRRVKYARKARKDPWQFPDETLSIRKGDCEDRAFLIASLLLASGISGYHVRVALGHVRVSSGRLFDHAWVMYKNEAGRWMLMEPLLDQPAHGKTRVTLGKARSGKLPRGYRPHEVAVEYVPLFLFNTEHLWAVGQGHSTSFEQVAGKTWSKMSPAFAGVVHETIIHKALSDIVPPVMMSALDARFRPAVLGVVGPTVDDSDRGTYDPLDHFDNGLVDESWALVTKRIDQFRANPTDYVSFAKAAHGVADFYSHSSYGHFAWIKGPPAVVEPRADPYDPARLDELLHDVPDYGPGDGETDFDLTSAKFSVNPVLWKNSKEAAAERWSGRIISGRYGQPSDTQGDLIDHLAIEGPAVLPGKYLTASRGALPHHIEIAVDAPEPNSRHRLYAGVAYANQYRFRVNTAVEHIRRLYLEARA